LELGNIYAKRDWSHSKDFVKGIWLMLNQSEPKEYLLASGETHTVKEFIEKAFEFAEINGFWTHSSEEKIEINEQFHSEKGQVLVRINPIFYRPAEVDLLMGDPQKAIEYLNWKPEISFKELVKEMVFFDINNLKV
jgi:GDPmannose 4,6-dehydratase